MLPRKTEENSGGAKRREETPAHNMSCQPPRNPHSGIHQGWEMHTLPGRTPRHRTKYRHRNDDWPRQGGRLTPSLSNLMLSHAAELFPFPAVLHIGAAFQPSLLFGQSMWLLSLLPSVKQESTLWPWTEPHSSTICSNMDGLREYHTKSSQADR